MQILLRISAENQTGTHLQGLYCFETVQEVEQFLQHWLRNACGIDCVQEPNAVDEENLLCPVVQQAADLESYAGYHFFGSLGSVELLLQVIYDAATARQFRMGLVKEFALDQSFEEAADELLVQLDSIEAYYAGNADLSSEALAAVDRLIRDEGLPMF